MTKLTSRLAPVLLCITLPLTAVAAEPAFETNASGMTKGLNITLESAPSGRKSLSAGSGEQVEVMRQTGLDVEASRAFEPVERVPAARINLKIEFDFNSAEIRSSSRPLLAELARSLNSPELEGARIAINGHTDAVGSDAYNLILSFRRAQAVRDYLIESLRIDADRLEIAGYGESLPLVANNTDNHRQLNRRVEIERLR